MPSQNGIDNQIPDNDFTVTNNDCGATAFISCTNSCTDASSDSVIEAVVASATAGDPFINFEVNAVTDWSVGIDNSVTSPAADPFIISASSTLGTTNVLVGQTSGEVNLPLQPVFGAFVNSTVSNVTGTGFYDIIFNTEKMDIGSNYSTSTGLFTAPVNGYYRFTFTCLLQDMTTSHSAGFALITSNAPFSLSNNASAFTGNNCYGAAWIVPMDAADTAQIQVGCFGPSKTIDVYGAASDPRTYFSGVLFA